MPELPEVERARKLVSDACTGYTITDVDAREDKIVYTGGCTHEDYIRELNGRVITGCERKGKVFWMTLTGEGRLPVMHFGMNGMIQIKGQEPTWYKRRPRERPKGEWPPKYTKFALTLTPPSSSSSTEQVFLAFLDSRRLGRLRLSPAPVHDHPPVKQLGFDPMLNMPSLEEFQKLIGRKKGTVKGVIMDQSFSAGVGNWVADEILYQAAIHPACPIPHLTPDQIGKLHHWIRKVPEIAVSVNADHNRFPESWLFRWRWGKGKKQERRVAKAVEGGQVVVMKEEVKVVDTAIKQEASVDEASEVGSGESEGEEAGDVKPKGVDILALPNGQPATITFIEVGGRTTALVAEVQKMPEGVEIKPKLSRGQKGVKVEADSQGQEEQPAGSKRQSKAKEEKQSDASSDLTDLSEPETKPVRKARKTSSARSKTVASASKRPSLNGPHMTPTYPVQSSSFSTLAPLSSIAITGHLPSPLMSHYPSFAYPHTAISIGKQASQAHRIPFNYLRGQSAGRRALTSSFTTGPANTAKAPSAFPQDHTTGYPARLGARQQGAGDTQQWSVTRSFCSTSRRQCDSRNGLDFIPTKSARPPIAVRSVTIVGQSAALARVIRFILR